MNNLIKKSFKCEICTTHFTHKSSLTLHISSLHEGKKLFRCEMCGKSFNQKTNLTRHLRAVHEGKKAFKCKICDYSCSRKSNMNDHVYQFITEISHSNVKCVTTALLEKVT